MILCSNVTGILKFIINKNIDGGRATEAAKLEPGQSSGKFLSMNGDGYYFVKLIKKTKTEVNFVSIKVPFTEFNKRFEALQNDNKINTYITIGNSTEDTQPAADNSKSQEAPKKP